MTCDLNNTIKDKLMKKLLTAFIAAVLMISCVGCGNNAEIEALRKDVDELKATV